MSISGIQKDIERFEARIQTAREKIAGLPSGRLPFKKHRKREKVRRDCKAEIKHVKGLITYAREGIKLRKSGLMG